MKKLDTIESLLRDVLDASRQLARIQAGLNPATLADAQRGLLDLSEIIERKACKARDLAINVAAYGRGYNGNDIRPTVMSDALDARGGGAA